MARPLQHESNATADCRSSTAAPATSSPCPPAGAARHRLPAAQPRPLGQPRRVVDAVWGKHPPAAAATTLSALLSRLRSALGDEVVRGRSVPVVRFAPGSTVDSERAASAVHEAEGPAGRGERVAAYLRSQEHYITEREFLSGHDLTRVEEWRRRLAAVNLKSLEINARTALAIGGSGRSAAGGDPTVDRRARAGVHGSARSRPGGDGAGAGAGAGAQSRLLRRRRLRPVAPQRGTFPPSASPLQAGGD